MLQPSQSLARGALVQRGRKHKFSGKAIPRHLREPPAVLGGPEKRVQAQMMGAENTEAKGRAQTDRKREQGDPLEQKQCDSVGDGDRVAPQGEGELGWGWGLANPLGTLYLEEGGTGEKLWMQDLSSYPDSATG